MEQSSKMLNPFEAVVKAAKGLSVTKGRSRRSEFWWPMLLVLVAGYFVKSASLCFLLFLCTIGLTVRRLHDTGRSGWWLGGSVLLKLGYGVLITVCVLIFGNDVLNALQQITSNYIQTSGLYDNMVVKYGSMILLIVFYPIVVFAYDIMLLIFCALDGEPCENKYGPSPKYNNGASLEKKDNELEDKVM